MEAIPPCPLFTRWREVAALTALLLALFGYNLYHTYTLYRSVVSEPIHTTTATVLNQYVKTKGRRSYTVFKMRSTEGYRFYTTSYEDLKDLRGRRVWLKLVTKRIDFLSFLRGFYAPSFDLRLDASDWTLRGVLLQKIAAQHANMQMRALYEALFLGRPIPRSLRKEVSFLGISHLIAISGFHLAVLFGALFMLLRPFYRFAQERYFPWRHMRRDLSLAIMVLLGGYLWLVGVLPSLLRSFVMLVLGFWLYHRHIRLLSFSTLLLTVGVILASMPEFLFSIGFWFSVGGVFFIYLFLHHWGGVAPWKLFVGLNLWVFVTMLPLVHSIFPLFSWYQLLSPLWSMLFGLFYPIALGAHLIGAGGLFDPWLSHLFSLRGQALEVETPLWFLLLYLGVALWAIRWRVLAYLLPLLSLSLVLVSV